MQALEADKAVWALAGGGTAVLLQNSGTQAVLDTLVQERITHLHCLPRTLQDLVADVPEESRTATPQPSLASSRR
jgi:acyl-CoA synthetase (AMP-forming)/AMP-acid ligase II